MSNPQPDKEKSHTSNCEFMGSTTSVAINVNNVSAPSFRLEDFIFMETRRAARSLDTMVS
jgi:hypothetical protein